MNKRTSERTEDVEVLSLGDGDNVLPRFPRLRHLAWELPWPKLHRPTNRNIPRSSGRFFHVLLLYVPPPTYMPSSEAMRTCSIARFFVFHAQWLTFWFLFLPLHFTCMTRYMHVSFMSSWTYRLVIQCERVSLIASPEEQGADLWIQNPLTYPEQERKLEKHIRSVKSGCEPELDGLQCTQPEFQTERDAYLREDFRQKWICRDLKNHAILRSQTSAKMLFVEAYCL